MAAAIRDGGVAARGRRARRCARGIRRGRGAGRRRCSGSAACARRSTRAGAPTCTCRSTSRTSRLAVARTDAEALVALPGGAALYADASLRLGAVLGNLGRATDAQAALALALALDPDRPIDAVRVLARRGRGGRRRARARAADPRGRVRGRAAGRDRSRRRQGGRPRAGRRDRRARPARRGRARAAVRAARAQAVAIDAATANVALELVARRRPPPPSRAASRSACATSRAGWSTPRSRTPISISSCSSRRPSAAAGRPLLVQRCAGAPARCTAIVELGYGDRDGLVRAARTAWREVKRGELRYPPSVFGDPRLGGTSRRAPLRVVSQSVADRRRGGVVVVATVAMIAVVTASKPPPTVIVNPGQY